MSYTEKLTLTIPATLYDVACSISRALDPDVGGDKSWTAVSTEEGVAPTEYFTETPCTPEFKEKAILMLSSPETLYMVVSADYEERWQQFTPPTIKECEDFCNAVVLPPPQSETTEVI